MEKAPSEKIFLIDSEKCTGCKLCEAVCAFCKEREFNPTRSRIHILKWERTGLDIPMVCLHCDTPICESVCPTRAICRNNETGAMVIDYDLCIGCKMCVFACPFGGISVDLKKRRVIKCDLCDGDPRCVRFCSPGAIQYVKASRIAFMKKRHAVEQLSELIKKVVVT